MGINLLEKTELWINNIFLSNANLTDIANETAKVFGIDCSKVLVVDVRPEHITLDILENDIPTENIIGKEKELLDAISRIDGITITNETYIHSNGILGMICANTVNPVEISKNVDSMVREMREKISKRAIVFPTGFELKRNMIEDTNTPYLKRILEERGFNVTVGDIIEDDFDEMVYKISDAVSRAYGLIITTGGVGAEDKDKTVESVLEVDPAAATPYIVKFKQGTGRHVKDGVRIAVGTVGPSMIVSLPGPNDEVRVATEVLMNAIESNYDKNTTAGLLANSLAEKIANKRFHHHK